MTRPITRLITVDAFTDRPFAGNPAAVCVLPAARDEAWMRTVAAELNLSETAFLVPQSDAPERDGYHLRWFTPAVEVALCGHATLASAHVLWEDGHLPPGAQARFHTLSGLLTAEQRDGWIELDFPQKPAIGCAPPPGLLAALGVAAVRAVAKNQFDYLLELDADATVRALAPNHAALAALPVRGVMVTARSASPEFDFVSRFFAPGSGIAEDPVTGSAHTALGPYWAAQLGKHEMTAYQASPRGGIVRLRLTDDRILLAGQAITVLSCDLHA